MNYALLAVAVIAVAVSLGIANSQRRDLQGYRRADRQQEAERAHREHIRQERLTRRDSWQPEFEEIQNVLIQIEDIESEIRQQGPFDRDAIRTADIGRLQRRVQNLSDRCPATLKAPLRKVAEAVDELRGISVYPDADVVDAYRHALTGSAPHDPPPEFMASAIGMRGIEQYQAAVDLHHAVSAAWEAIHTERGGEP